jgi:HlyD family secretion protein
MTPRRKRWFLALGVLGLAGLLVYGFWPEPVPVTTATVSRGPLEVTVAQEGRTRVTDHYTIATPVAGHLQRVEHEVGDPVPQGAVVARLTPGDPPFLDPRSTAEARARVEQAEARVEQAEATVAAAASQKELAAAELARTRRLVTQEQAPREQLDRTRAALRKAEAELRSARFAAAAARHERAAAETALRYGPGGKAAGTEPLTLRSPVAGRILTRHRESAGPIGAGEPVMTVGDPRSLEVAADVLSRDAVRIEPGMPVRFTDWGGDAPLRGEVTRVEPVAFTEVSALGVEEQRVWVISRLTSPPERWRKLGDGYRVEADFVVWSGDDVLQVPESALFRHQEQWAVFVVEDGVARRRIVEPGQRSGLKAQIRAGLEVGKRVITHPGNQIEPGVAVTPRAQPESGD